MQQMLNNLRARREDERGFTLIELMVVVLIIAILIAIAIPTFLGAKTRAQDKAAQSSLRNGLTNAKGIYTDTDSYGTSATLVAGLTAAEPSLTFQTTVSTGQKEVSVAAADTYTIMTAESSSGVCFAIGDWSTGGTFFAKVSGACTAANAATSAGTGVPTSAPANATTNDTWAQAW
jgi:type IV pilus assembly protein PilA